jgi:hypothetical protein
MTQSGGKRSELKALSASLINKGCYEVNVIWIGNDTLMYHLQIEFMYHIYFGIFWLAISVKENE